MFILNENANIKSKSTKRRIYFGNYRLKSNFQGVYLQNFDLTSFKNAVVKSLITLEKVLKYEEENDDSIIPQGEIYTIKDIFERKTDLMASILFLNNEVYNTVINGLKNKEYNESVYSTLNKKFSNEILQLDYRIYLFITAKIQESDFTINIVNIEKRDEYYDIASIIEKRFSDIIEALPTELTERLNRKDVSFMYKNTVKLLESCINQTLEMFNYIIHAKISNNEKEGIV